MTILTKEQSATLETLNDIDWDNWTGAVQATLLFLLIGDKVLMIQKKTGLGAGKYNAAGGKLEEGETIEEGALRELEEELCVKAIKPKLLGELKFQFRDGYSLHTYAFLSKEFEGIPKETREAIPVWFEKDKLPFDDMWEDDPYWVPLLLEGKEVTGKFLFDGDNMLDHDVHLGLQ